jgi:hypothetical protein
MHDDIDALFGRWSMLLRKDNFPTIPLLMKPFKEVESIPTILISVRRYLISKVLLRDVSLRVIGHQGPYKSAAV